MGETTHQIVGETTRGRRGNDSESKRLRAKRLRANGKVSETTRYLWHVCICATLEILSWFFSDFVDITNHVSCIKGGSTGCATVLTGPSGFILSPDQTGDGKYDSYVTCVWTIHLGDDFVIVFDVTEMDIEKTLECRADFLEVIN